MTDTEMLDLLEQITDPNLLGSMTASTKVSAKRNGHQPVPCSLYRLGDGPWGPSLRDAIHKWNKRYWNRIG